ncbi:nonsense-mediated mRNA decay factor SMG8, partial [Patella vulgata]|uniref:nonsense-mediated mRNA decay factor SMG8 n=1 Tax=Patella vulgata TaxID=6465 RepID=UPI00217F3950
DIFQGAEGFLGEKIDKRDLEIFYDVDNQVVYLHYQSFGDAHRLADRCQELFQEKSTVEFHSIWEDNSIKHAKTLLYLFSISHIVLICHPGSTFDIGYVKLFKILDMIRLKLQGCLTEELSDYPISKDWYTSARLCSPRVLFVFQTATFELNYEDSDLSYNKSRAQKSPPIKKLQLKLEDQIYRILRKSRVITNISNNSLFAVPANHEFVYVHTKREDVVDPVISYLQLLRNFNTPVKEESPKSRSYLTNRRAGQGPITSSSFTGRVRESNFREFLWQHIELAFSKGFNDNVGRNPVSPIFELPVCDTWFQIALKLHRFFFTDIPEGKPQSHFNTLRSLLETDVRFSENRCNKYLPLAETAYQQDLPKHYIRSYHLQKLAQAKHVFSQFARGPAYEKYMKQLEESCEKWWKADRQRCEAISLTRNFCINPLHRLEDDIETDVNKHLPIMPHCSQIKTKAACNCGRKQADKEDCFDHKSANFDFYESLSKTCCNKLNKIDLPAFKASTTEATARHVLPVPEQVIQSHSQPHQRSSVVDTKRIDSGMSVLSLALSLEQSGTSDVYSHGQPENLEQDDGLSQPEREDVEERDGGDVTEDQDKEVVLEGDKSGLKEVEVEEAAGGANKDGGEEEDVEGEGPDKDVGQEETEEPESEDEIEETVEESVVATTSRQHSTTEYLPGMIHTDSPPGLLPKFTSWSLCCLGKPSFYSHSQGLDLPGFLAGSNFLLPWDITVKANKEKWPTVGETAGKKGRQKRPNRDVGEVTLRVYLGNEYECPRGHRFFCSGPDKIIKVSSMCSVKDNATKLLTLDMPLYTPCNCRTTKMNIAQLMRLYIVTPDGPVKILINPMIQPAVSPCPLFHPGTDRPIELPASGVWCLRLPHVYQGDRGVYTMPTDGQQLHMCRLMKGAFSYKETPVDG